MESDKPDPRFKEYVEVQDETGKTIGFKLEGNDFLFRYDAKGGWFDEDKHYFNKHGVFMYKQEEWDDPDEAVDEQDVKHLQDMILKEEGGKSESDDEESSEEELPKVCETIQQKISCVIDEITKGNFLRESKKNQLLRIYIRVKKQSEKKKESFQKTYDATTLEKQIRNLRIKYDEETKKAAQSLPKQALLTYSVQDDQVYWVGYVQVKPQQFNATFQQLSKDKTFGILKKKTLLHLNFFIERNDAAQKELKSKLLEKLKDKKDGVKLTVNNLTDLPPVSYAVDLLDECNIKLQDIESIKMDKNSFDVVVPVDKAANIIELVHFEKDQKQYLGVEIGNDGQKVSKSQIFTVEFEDKKCQTKELFDKVLVYSDQSCVLKPAQGLLIVHQNFLRTVLLLRDNNFVPVSIAKFAK